MILDTKPIIKQKNQSFLTAASRADWGHLQHVRTLMGLSRRRYTREEALDLIRSRQIRWAWDISRRNARRPELRLWRESLLAFLSREESEIDLTGPRDGKELSAAQVIETILPRPVLSLGPRAATVSARELQRRLLCSRPHLDRLVADGELCPVRPNAPGRGKAILYQSAFEFLKRRILSL